MTRHYVLTPADIMDLRSSLRGGRMADGCGSVPAPFIVYVPTDDAYALHAHGFTWCLSPRIEVLAACLRAERLEHGWLARALAPGETCIEALLSVEERAAIVRRKRAEDAIAKHTLASASPRELSRTSLEDFL